MIKVKINGEEKDIEFKNVDMEAQEKFIVDAEKVEGSGKPIEMLKFVKSKVIEHTEITEEQWKKLSTEDGNKVISAIMNKFKPKFDADF